MFYEINIPYAKRLQKFKNYSPSELSNEVNKPVEYKLFKSYYQYSNDFFRFYLLTTYIFGLRISELRGLTIDSFDLNNNYLYILRSNTNKAGVGHSIDLSPKSKSSIRKYYLATNYLNMLNDFIKTNKLKPHDRLIFNSMNKKLAIGESSIRRYLNEISSKNNLEHITPHGLRHGIATYLYSKGISFEDIGKYLGHKFNSVTMDVYIDLTKERQLKIIEEINNLISDITSNI